MNRAIGCLLLIAWCGAAAGADPAACAGVDDDAARLACYDQYFGRAAPGRAAPGRAASGQAAPGQVAPGGTVPAASAKVQAADPVAAFGDRGQLPATRRLQADLPKRLESRVVKVEPLAGGLYRLALDNGQVWVTREADWALEFKSGDAVTIQRMVLGAYRISHSGEGRNVSVGRIL